MGNQKGQEKAQPTLGGQVALMLLPSGGQKKTATTLPMLETLETAEGSLSFPVLRPWPPGLAHL